MRRGEVVTVLDRSTPVAPGRVPLPPRLTPPADVVALLLEERQGDR